MRSRGCKKWDVRGRGAVPLDEDVAVGVGEEHGQYHIVALRSGSSALSPALVRRKKGSGGGGGRRRAMHPRTQRWPD